jgi:hypothetical protein
METKISKERIESLKNFLDFAGFYVVFSVGLSGGIALFWIAEMRIEVNNFSSCHIDAMVRREGKTISVADSHGSMEL